MICARSHTHYYYRKNTSRCLLRFFFSFPAHRDPKLFNPPHAEFYFGYFGVICLTLSSCRSLAPPRRCAASSQSPPSSVSRARWSTRRGTCGPPAGREGSPPDRCKSVWAWHVMAWYGMVWHVTRGKGRAIAFCLVSILSLQAKRAAGLHPFQNCTEKKNAKKNTCLKSKFN